jgi:protein tyrosine phosphatase (PTP) superfamily phosphohydrolase (DUF442 family)
MAAQKNSSGAGRPDMRKRSTFLVWGVLAAAIVAVIGIAVWRKDYPAHHFAVVEKGGLYRSGQPKESGWQAIKDTHHIKTVVDLREINPDAPWSITEREFCRRNGIALVHLPLGPMTDAELKRFCEIVMDSNRQPVLVHCQAGSIRTGVLVASYRIAVQGWSYEDALAEARRFRFSPARHKQHDAFLRRLAGGDGWRPDNAGADRR